VPVAVPAATYIETTTYNSWVYRRWRVISGSSVYGRRVIFSRRRIVSWRRSGHRSRIIASCEAYE